MSGIFYDVLSRDNPYLIFSVQCEKRVQCKIIVIRNEKIVWKHGPYLVELWY